MKTRVIIAWIFLVGGLTSVLLLIGYNLEKENRSFYTLEADIKESASAYLDIYDIKLDVGDEVKIEIKKLIEDELIDKEKFEEDECDGFIIVKKSITNVDIKPYIKCKNYKSLDYDKKK